MKNKALFLCSLLICIALFFTLGVSAFAAQTLHVHPRATFEIPIGSSDALNAAGDAYLTADITLSSDVVITDTLSLCLNGFDINMGPYSITIEKDASLSVYDCPENPGGAFVVGAGDKAAIEVYGKFNLTGGNYFTEGRPVLFNHGETFISGGLIEGADTQLVQTNGSGVLVVSFGDIIASGSGSAIAMINAPEDEGAGKRDYNVAIGGGNITAQAGSPGTVVVNAVKGRFVINSGANLVGQDCPAVRVESGSFDAYGGAVVYSDTASAIVGVGGKVNLYFATVTSDEVYGVDISEDAELLLSGSLDVVGGNAGIRLAEGKVFSMSDYGFYGDVRISIHTDVVPTEGNPVPISTPCEAKHYSHFLSATPSASITYTDRVIYNSYDGTVAHSHDNRNYVLPLYGSYSDLSKNNYYLEDDLSCNGFFTGSVVNICLNGHTLNLGSAIRIYPNSTLNIYDCQGTGKIVANSNCITDVNGGAAKVIVHQGTVVSNSSAPIKLTGDDTVIIKGGKVMSQLEGSCAIDAVGLNNSVIVESGSIEGVASAIKIQDGSISLSGEPEGLIKGDFIARCTGMREGEFTVDGNVTHECNTADILLSKGKLLAVGEEIDPAAKYSVALEVPGSMTTLSAPSDKDISAYFESTDSAMAMMCNEENILMLAARMPASPESAEIGFGESAEFKADYTGGGTASYLWRIRNPENGEFKSLTGANSAVFSTPSDLESGVYEVYCTVTDEARSYVSDKLSLTVKKDVIEIISVSAASPEINYTGEPVNLQLNASASTTMGRSVSFSYSADGVNYSDAIPAFGPDAGQYTLYYIASAEGCEDVKGQLSFEIKAVEEVETESESRRMDISPRLIAIIASSVILLVLCIIFILQLARKKRDD